MLLKVEDIMHANEAIPLVKEDALMKDALIEMTSKRLGVAGVCDNERNLTGIITDGDLRRCLGKFDNFLQMKASQIMTKKPKTIEKNALAAMALKIMEQFSITVLFVLARGQGEKVEGIIHMHDLLRAGIA